MKTTSKTAVAVAAGMLFSLSSAYAADLGGNCCNDLEERVAELEATAARKGTRNVSLTISGQVNRLIMNYSDGGTNKASTPYDPLIAGSGPGNLASNTFWGIDNVNSSSRFNLTGNGKIDATRKAGYNITVEIASGGRSTNVNQSRAEGAAVATTSPGYSQFGLNDQALAVRDANVWIEDSRLGRLTLGRLTPSGAQGTIDLGGIGVIAPSTSLVGSGLGFRNAANGLVSSIAASYDANGNLNNRSDGIRYETPTYQGFQAAFTFAEASNQVGFVAPTTAGPLNSGNGDLGQVWAANLRYANEFNGVRVAAAIGYERNSEDSQSSPAGVDKRHLGFSGSLMHVATGLFVQGSYTKISTTEASFVPDVTRDGSVFHIAGGVSKNWFGVGNTSLYGEYGAGDDMFFVHRVGGAVAGDGGKFWGLGVVQNVNSANLELYAGYRNHSATLAAQGPLKDVNILATGMRIKF